MRRETVSNIAFYVTTAMLILIIGMCVGGTVKSGGRNETQRIENRVQEQQLLTQMRQYLNENGYRNSGVTLTYVTDEDGSCDYTFTIHHKKIDAMSEEETLPWNCCRYADRMEKEQLPVNIFWQTNINFKP